MLVRNGKETYKMLIGTYYHTLEENGRVSLPKNFREESTEWVITRGLDGCLFLFTKHQYAEEMKTISGSSFTKKSNRDFTRLMATEAYEVELDKNGRVQLPEYLIDKASLKKHVAVTGNFSRIEIWDREAYHGYVDSLENSAETIAEGFEYKKKD